MSTASMRSRSRRILLGVTAIATAAIVLSGCRAADAGASDSDKASGDGLVIGWSQRGICGSDWWKTLVAGGESQAKKIGAELVCSMPMATRPSEPGRADPDHPGRRRRHHERQRPDRRRSLGRGAQEGRHPARDRQLESRSDSSSPTCSAMSRRTSSPPARWPARWSANRRSRSSAIPATIKLVGIGGFPGDVITELRFNGFMKGYDDVM